MKLVNNKLNVISVVDHTRYWSEFKRECAVGLGINRRLRVANNLDRVDWDKFNLNDYLLTHDTIVIGVNTDKHDGHTVTKGSVPYINSNNNCWFNDVLGPPTNIYRSFIGGENYFEHVQVPMFSKGKILDAVLREVKNKAGEKTYACDILVATHRRHRDLVARIESRRLQTLSMGCIADITQCSKCGKVVTNDGNECNHLKYEIGQEYTTPYGYKSRVAEVCGVKGKPRSCYFIEASWVESPAFEGAVVNHFLNNSMKEFINDELPDARVIRFSGHDVDLFNISDDDFNMLTRLRVADKPGMIGIRLMVEGVRNIRKRNRVKRIVSDLLLG